MKTSILVIAQNEEKYIAHCIESILKQTIQADEVVLVVHNSTDRTRQIAEAYPIRVIPFNGPEGTIYATAEGLNHVSGDMVVCTDGDSYVARNWVEVMTKTLQRGNTLVGSWVRFKGTLYGRLTNIFNKFLCVSYGDAAAAWIWGASIAFYAKDKEYVRDTFLKSIELSKQLQLTRNPSDYWLALFMSKKGRIEVTNKTYVWAYTKETSSRDMWNRNAENRKNGERMYEYFYGNKKELRRFKGLKDRFNLGKK